MNAPRPPYEIDRPLQRWANAIGTTLLVMLAAYGLLAWLAGWP